MPYTTDGHWYGEGEPTQPGPKLVARCGGIYVCSQCAQEAGTDRPAVIQDASIANLTVSKRPRPPVVGEMVHYVSEGSPVKADGSQKYTKTCRAAVVTEVDPADPLHVGLMAVQPSALSFRSLAEGGCVYDEGGETPGDPNCPEPHGDMPFRYCPQPGCGWAEASLKGGTWHWPERV